jgi:hypothetical protein
MKTGNVKAKLPKKFNVSLSVHYAGVGLKKPVVKVNSIKKLK